ncbi:hypothetical protein J437_LFUL016966 [Ladona fulva]|uniref:SAM domain-containing protein n=1 Tax=Ladona fulva TaxID=123851 RepID=A0A8K0KJJ8_LADFU|nr:hypothetical protein J437_LFUL016966 [Ladona fulva]
MWPRMPDACPTPGCRGLGNSRGAPYAGHMSPSACPLTSKVLPPLPDRLDPSVKPPPPKIKRSESPPASSEWEGAPESRPAKPRIIGAVTQNPPARQQPSGLPPPPPLRLGPAHLPGYGRGIGRGTASRAVPRHDGPTAAEARDVRRDVHRSVFSPGYMPNPDRVTPLCWDRHSRLLYPYVNGDTLPGREASRWTRDEVVKFVENIPGCKERAKVFRDEQIDGEAFLLLNQNDIVTLLGFKLGPAIKVYNSIVLLRQRLTT